MRKIKKIMLGFVGVCMVASLCACNSDKDKTDVKVTKTETIEVSTTETEKPDVSTTESEKTEAQVTEETQTTQTTQTTESVKAEDATTESVSGGIEETTTSETSTPGPDVAELVNLRGDETTVYKLADGTYMDRIDRRFTFDRTETWVDEDGVEWNEVVK